MCVVSFYTLLTEVRRKWKNMRDCFWRKRHLQKRKWNPVVPRTNMYNVNDDQMCWAKMEMLVIMRAAKSTVFQPQYAQCSTATTSLPQTYDYNF